MIDINPTISITTLNVNGLNVPIKKKRSSQWIKKQNQLHVYKKPYMYIHIYVCIYVCVYTYICVYIYILNGWRKIYHSNTIQKKSGGAILILDGEDNKARTFLRDEEGGGCACVGKYKEFSLPSVKFCGEPKSALK